MIQIVSLFRLRVANRARVQLLLCLHASEHHGTRTLPRPLSLLVLTFVKPSLALALRRLLATNNNVVDFERRRPRLPRSGNPLSEDSLLGCRKLSHFLLVRFQVALIFASSIILLVNDLPQNVPLKFLLFFEHFQCDHIAGRLDLVILVAVEVLLVYTVFIGDHHFRLLLDIDFLLIVTACFIAFLELIWFYEEDAPHDYDQYDNYYGPAAYCKQIVHLHRLLVNHVACLVGVTADLQSVRGGLINLAIVIVVGATPQSPLHHALGSYG